MTLLVDLPDELIEQIDGVAADRTAFVAEAVRRLLRDAIARREEVERINAVADELNREAADVLEFQTFSPLPEIQQPAL